MSALVQRLIAEERRVARDADAKNRAAFEVCAKLRAPLSTLAGAAGFRSLLSRALMLAQAEAPFLAGVKIQPDGTFHFSPETEAQLASPEAARASALMADQLVGLLITFIGETLTLRLVQDIWPTLTLKDSASPRDTV